MKEFVTVAKWSELKPGKGKAVQVAGQELALFRLGSECYALANACPHVGAALADGEIEGTEIICPWHGARFDLRTGQVLEPPAYTDVDCYRVRLQGDDVQVEV